MTNTLNGKVAAVTGAASGIGLACARTMLGAGAEVVLIDRAEDRLRALCEELGPEAHPLVVDLMEGAAVSGILPRILKRTGRLDIFHANAGAYIGGDVTEGDPDVWDRVLHLNVNAAFRSIHAVLPHMVERKEGSIIIIASIAGLKGSVDLCVYAISKVAEHQIARNLAVEYGPHNIRVNAIAPGLIKTDFAKALWTDPKRLDAIENRLPLRRIGDPDDIAGATLFLASPAAAYVTGQVLNVCGGASVV